MRTRGILLTAVAVLSLSINSPSEVNARGPRSTSSGSPVRNWSNFAQNQAAATAYLQGLAARTARYDPNAIARQYAQQAKFVNAATALQTATTNLASTVQQAVAQSGLTTASPVVTAAEQVVHDVFGPITSGTGLSLVSALNGLNRQNLANSLTGLSEFGQSGYFGNGTTVPIVPSGYGDYSGFGGYGGGSSYGGPAGTAAGAALQGLGDVTTAQGQYNQATSLAAIEAARAQSNALQNQVQAVQTGWEVAKIGACGAATGTWSSGESAGTRPRGCSRCLETRPNRSLQRRGLLARSVVGRQVPIAAKYDR